MITLKTKTDTSAKSSLPLNLPASDKEGSSLSFSELLKGVGVKTSKSENASSKDDKVVQNGALLLALDNDEKDLKSTKTSTKSDTLLNLLKNDDTASVKTEEPLVLNPKITEELGSKEVKILVGDAKEYLKSKILQSDDYKKSQIKDLPKTLKGLVEVAKKIGIDITKISVEEVQADTKTKKTEIQLQTGNKFITKDTQKGEISSQSSVRADKKQDVKVKTITDALNIKQDVKAQTLQTKGTEDTIEVKTDVKQEKSSPANVADVKPEVKSQEAQKTDSKISDSINTKETTKPDLKTTDVLSAKESQKTNESIKIEPKVQPQQAAVAQRDTSVKETKAQELKSTPLFKAQTKPELTTQEIIQTKFIKTEEKTPKARADETLSLLLRGEKPSVTNPALTADFSTQTAKVLMSKAPSDAAQSLEKLLRGDSSESKNESNSISKTDGLSTHKADSFEVKLNEAKQMIKYLSSDVKTAIEDYKSPFTRVKVQLNPQRLGGVDLTVVQRGNNLHVNISSNNAAINTLVMNANELRTQLNNNGINNASLNFNNHSDSGNSGGGGQQNQRNTRDAHEEYNYLDNKENNEEILSSLEIVVPQYI